MPTENEFREIGHSGGRFTVTSKTQEDGRRTFQMGWSSSRPVPQSIITVQVNFSGEVLGVTFLSWEPDRIGEKTGPTDNFPVFIASDREGLFGHQCRRCDTYWRSDGYPANWPTTCPRCGLRKQSHGFLTGSQLNFIGAVLEKVSEAIDSEEDGEHTIDMDALSDDVQNGVEVPDFYYAEESQQCRFRCMTCGSRNDILGKYGHCSCCGYRNNLKIFIDETDGSLETLKSSSRPEDYVKLLVSAFDSCAKNYLASLKEQTPLTPLREKSCGRILFHNVNRAPELVRTYFDIRLLKGLNVEDKEFLNLMFHRRHVFEHCGGVADQRYLDEAGDTSIKLGQALRETSPNVRRFGDLLKRMATNFDEGYHQIFPPDKKAVQMCGPRMVR